MRWFRFYSDAVNDPKVQRLPGEIFKGWVNLLCLASSNNGDLPCLEDIAFSLRITEEAASELIETLFARGLLDKADGEYRPHNWSARQHESDISTERVKRFRNRFKPVSETPPDTEQIQSQKQKEEEGAELRSDAPPPKEKGNPTRGTRLSETWEPSEIDIAFAEKEGLRGDDRRREIVKFRNYWVSKSGKDASKLNWSRTWQNWVLDRRGYGNRSRQSFSGGKGSDYVAGIRKVAANISGNSPMARATDEAVPLGRVNIDG